MTNLEGRHLTPGWVSDFVRKDVVAASWMAEQLAGLPGPELVCRSWQMGVWAQVPGGARALM